MLVYLVEKESFITPFRSGEFPSVKPFSVEIAFGDRLEGGEETLPATVDLLIKTAFSWSVPVVGLGLLSVTTWTSSPESVSKMRNFAQSINFIKKYWPKYLRLCNFELMEHN